MELSTTAIIDSGVGGLSVYRHIRALLPNLPLLYLADTLYVPYGMRSEAFITTRAHALVSFLQERDIRTIVIACNTITVTCLQELRQAFPEIQFIGTVPVIKKAAERSQNKKIGVLSTTRTAESVYQTTLITRFAGDCAVFSWGSDELVPFVERGELESDELSAVLTRVLKPFLTESCDTLVLGCTHFPFLRESITRVLGDTCLILDSGAAVARQLERVLALPTLPHTDPGSAQFLTTGDITQFQTIVRRLLAEEIPTESFSQAQV